MQNTPQLQTLPTGLCVWKGGLYFLSLCLWMLHIKVELSRQLVCTVTLSVHIPKWAFLWQVIYPCIKFNHKDSPSVLLSVETASRWVHQLVLELPPAAVSLSAATTGPLGHLIYRTPLSEWISSSAAACSVVITVKSCLWRGVTMSHPIRSAWVGVWLDLTPGPVWVQGDTQKAQKRWADTKRLTVSRSQPSCGEGECVVVREGRVSFASMHLWLSLSEGWIAGLGRIYHTFHTHKEQCCKDKTFCTLCGKEEE